MSRTELEKRIIEKWKEQYDPNKIKKRKRLEQIVREYNQNAVPKPVFNISTKYRDSVFEQFTPKVELALNHYNIQDKSLIEIYAHDDTDGAIGAKELMRYFSQKGFDNIKVHFIDNYNTPPKPKKGSFVVSVDITVPYHTNVLVDHHDVALGKNADAKLVKFDLNINGNKPLMATASDLARGIALNFEKKMVELSDSHPNKREKRSSADYNLEELLTITGHIGDHVPSAVKFCSHMYQKKLAVGEDADLYSPEKFEMMKELSLYALLRIRDVKSGKVHFSEFFKELDNLGLKILGVGKALADPNFELLNESYVNRDIVYKVQNIIHNSLLIQGPGHYFIVMDKQSFQHATGVVANYLTCYSEPMKIMHKASKYVHNHDTFYSNLERALDSSTMFVAEDLENGSYKISFRGYSAEELKQILSDNSANIKGRGKVGGGVISKKQLLKIEESLSKKNNLLERMYFKGDLWSEPLTKYTL